MSIHYISIEFKALQTHFMPFITSFCFLLDGSVSTQPPRTVFLASLNSSLSLSSALTPFESTNHARFSYIT